MPARRRDFILYIGDTFQRQINLRSGPEADIADFTGEFIVYNDDDSERCSGNKEQAEAMHDRVVALIKEEHAKKDR